VQYRFRPHIPNCVDIDKPPDVAFDTLEELLSIPRIKQWKDKPSFYRYSIADNNTLMAELNSGYEWWVIGYVYGLVDLPRWEPKYTQADLVLAQQQEDAAKAALNDWWDKNAKPI